VRVANVLGRVPRPPERRQPGDHLTMSAGAAEPRPKKPATRLNAENAKDAEGAQSGIQSWR